MTIQMPEYGGCAWPIDPGCLSEEWNALSEAEKERYQALASSALRGLTAQRVGGCPVTVRPCRDRGTCVEFGSLVGPVNWAGRWYNNATSKIGCTSGCEIALPPPVGKVLSVRVDGQELDIDDMRLDNGHILVWQGGGTCPFPFAQDLSLPDTEPGTFSITYYNSYPVDGQGALAAGYLAMEFMKACKPKGKCSLPRGVTSVARNGVSFEIEAGLFPNGETGIDFVDNFVKSWNPDGRKQPSRVWSPGMAQMRTSRSL